MQPILFLQSGDTGTIKRISGAEDTRRFLAGLGFGENPQRRSFIFVQCAEKGKITDIKKSGGYAG